MKIVLSAVVDLEALNRQDPEDPMSAEEAQRWIQGEIASTSAVLAFGPMARHASVHQYAVALTDVSLTCEETEDV